MATPIKWEDADFKWNNNLYTWEDVVLVEEALRGGGDMGEMPWTKWEGDKKKRLIKLICQVQGKEFKQTKEITNYKIKISDIKMLAKEILNIEVMTENVKF
jgi:hypothetical protein|tara:strand:+ start:1474 stop:1776 length:303 start_codon:yes stop_codon:yes gene_type:complete